MPLRILAFAGPLLGWAIVRHRPPWGDEAHFLQTVRLFGDGVSLDLLRSYPEMSAPLTYVVYAAWGAIVGFETSALRLLSPAVAGATILTWHTFLKDVVRSELLVLVALATVVLNPYFLGLSVFVFTDMLALFGLALTAIGVSRRNAWLAGVGLAVATCARQYLAFLAIPLVSLVLLRPRARESWRWPAAGVAGMLPLGLLVWLWGGHLAPDNALRAIYTSEGLRFDPHALSLYLSTPAVYLFPLVGLMIPRLRWRPAPLAAAAVAAAIVVVFPVEPSIAQTREGSFAVGFLHRVVEMGFDPTLARVVFACLAFVNVWTLSSAFSPLFLHDTDERLLRSALFVWLGIAAFLLIMPLSYMPWEKYALPLLLLQSAALALAIDRRAPPESRGVRRD